MRAGRRPGPGRGPEGVQGVILKDLGSILGSLKCIKSTKNTAYILMFFRTSFLEYCIVQRPPKWR